MRRPPTSVGIRKLGWLPSRVVSKYPQCIAWFCHKARVWQTDGQTDGRTKLRLPGPRYRRRSRGKNTYSRLFFSAGDFDGKAGQNHLIVCVRSVFISRFVHAMITNLCVQRLRFLHWLTHRQIQRHTDST